MLIALFRRLIYDLLGLLSFSVTNSAPDPSVYVETQLFPASVLPESEGDAQAIVK